MRFKLWPAGILYLGAATVGAAQPCPTTPPPSCFTIVPCGPVDGIWTQAGSPYCITCDVAVGNLTIEPGVCVFVDGPHRIDVNVRLRVMGTALQPVVITSKDPQVPWKGIAFNDVGPGSELNHCTVSGSDSSAIRVASGMAPALRHCVITGNTTTGSGGAIQANVASGDFELAASTIAGNTASEHGGGLRVTMAAGGRLRMTDCRVQSNEAGPGTTTRVGGGLYLTGAAEIVRCRFVENTCTIPFGCCDQSALGAGAFFDGGATVVIRASTFSGNIVHATQTFGSGISRGGAIFVTGDTSLALQNCVVACNAATGNNPHTGGVWVESGQVSVMHCTIARNSSYGLYRSGGTASVRNSILYFNNLTGTTGPVYGPQLAGDASVCFCDVQGGAPAGCNNISVGPGFLASVFPATEPCCAQRFLLNTLSPCVDAGDPAPASDDACRPVGRGTARADMGAFGGPGNCDWTWESLCYPDFNRSCDLSVADFGSFQTGFVAADSYADCNGDGLLTVADFGCFQTRFVLGCP